MPAGSRRCPPLTGYTLIELILVIVILGIAGALLIPELSNRDRLAVQAAIRAVIGDIGFAATDAQANQEYRRVYFFNDPREGYCVVRITGQTPAEWDLPGDMDNCPDCSADVIVDRFKGFQPYMVEFNEQSRLEGVTINEVLIDDDVRFVTFDELGGTVYHDGIGVVPGVGGHIEIGYDDDTYWIRIQPFTGKLTVEECPPGGCM